MKRFLSFAIVSLAASISMGKAINDFRAGFTKSTNVDFNTGRGMDFGRGYDSFTDESSGACINYTGLAYDEDRTETSIQENIFKFELVESKYDLAKKLGVTASASLKSGFSRGSVSASYVEEQKLSQYSVYILVSAEVLTPPQRVVNETLDPYFVDLAATNPNVFREKCGNEFVATIHRGGLFYGLLRLDTEDSSSYNEIKASLRAKVGIFKGAADLERRILEVTQKKSFHIFVHQIGGESKANPTSIEELVERVQSFPIEVSQRRSPLRVVTVPYTQLRNYPIGPRPLDTAFQESVIDDLSRLRFRLTDEKNNIEYILNNPSQFATFEGSELNRRTDYLNAKLNLLHTATKRCFQNFENCAFPDSLGLEEFKLPQRLVKSKADLQCKPRVRSECGFIYKNTASPACKPKTFKVGSGEVCGVESYNVRSSNNCEPALYKTSSGAVCDVNLYKQGKSAVHCGSDLSGECTRFKPVDEAFADLKLGGMNLPRRGPSCRSEAKTCRNPAFGVESYKSCQHPSFGVETYKACEHSSHGIATFKQCRDVRFGVEEYQSCEDISHGVAGVKQCLLMETVDNETGGLKYEACDLGKRN